jgi:proteasome accessory factor C
MAKKSNPQPANPLEHTSRLLDLVPFITSHQGIAITELAKVFEVSTDQMVNDLTTLWMCGLPGYTPLELMDLDFESGFVSIKNAPTLARPRSVTHEEGVALLLGLSLLRTSVSEDRSDLLESIDSLVVKIATLIKLPADVKTHSNIRLDHVEKIQRALAEQQGLEISYHAIYKDEVTQRKIFPLEILEDDSLYLVAYCFVAEDFRHFRLDRITDISLIPVERPSRISLSKSDKLDFEIRIINPTRPVAELFELSQIEVDSTYVLASYSRFWVERSVLSAAGAAELLSPVELRNGIAEKARLILNRYLA